ncbi:PREDICTED: uncharacterized protein LOC106818269 [Priapulus caudatus]|uniref:Uncharacterized protein LOC106818269 n=1 Tax=Priapulus caudatus TaxID=37621 RepID=A0ABM1F206_PRICU|nr:PREDICTED: uncharacterized protein LOC106818269 [Priapulus caudatus]
MTTTNATTLADMAAATSLTLGDDEAYGSSVATVVGDFLTTTIGDVVGFLSSTSSGDVTERAGTPTGDVMNFSPRADDVFASTTSSPTKQTHPTTPFASIERNVKLIIYRVAFPLVVVVGLVGDSLNVAVLWRSARPSVGDAFYTLLRALAVADLAVNVALTPSVLIRADVIPYHTATTMWYYTHVNFFLLRTLTCASNLIVVLTRVVVVNATYATWGWNADLRASVFYADVWPVGREIISKGFPLVCVLALNPLIVRAHRQLLLRRRRLQQRRPAAAEPRDEPQLLRLLLSLSVAFVVCALPSAVLQALVRLRPHALSTTAFFVALHVTYFVEMCNYAANFYLYGVASADFRRRFREVFAVGGRQVAPAVPKTPTTERIQMA